MKLFKFPAINRLCSLRNFAIMSLALSFLWFLLFISGHPSQQNYFFRNCEDYMADCSNLMKYIKNYAPYHTHSFNDSYWHSYLPSGMLVFKPLHLFAQNIKADSDYASFFVGTLLMTFLSVILLMLLVSRLKKYATLDRMLLTVAILSSGIFLHSIERGNIIFASVICCGFFLFFHNSANKLLKELALVALAVAFALKITPAIFGVVLLCRKDYASACRAATYGLGIVLLGFLGIEGIIPDNFAIWRFNVHNLLVFSGMVENAFAREHILSFMSAFLSNLYGLEFTNSNVFIYIFQPALIIVFVTLLVSDFLKSPLWRQALHCALAVMLLPHVAYTYVVLYILPALVLWFIEEDKKGSDYLYFLFFLMLLCPFKIHAQLGTLMPVAIWLMLLESFVYAVVQLRKIFKAHQISLAQLREWIPFRGEPRTAIWWSVWFILLAALAVLLIWPPQKISEEPIFKTFAGKEKGYYYGTWDKNKNGLALICDFIPLPAKQLQCIFQIGHGKNSLQFLISPENKFSLVCDSQNSVYRNAVWLPEMPSNQIYRLLLRVRGNICKINLFIYDTNNRNWIGCLNLDVWNYNTLGVDLITVGSRYNDKLPFVGKIPGFWLLKESFNYCNNLAWFPGIGLLLMLLFPIKKWFTSLKKQKRQKLPIEGEFV